MAAPWNCHAVYKPMQDKFGSIPTSDNLASTRVGIEPHLLRIARCLRHLDYYCWGLGSSEISAWPASISSYAGTSRCPAGSLDSWRRASSTTRYCFVSCASVPWRAYWKNRRGNGKSFTRHRRKLVRLLQCNIVLDPWFFTVTNLRNEFVSLCGMPKFLVTHKKQKSNAL